MKKGDYVLCWDPSRIAEDQDPSPHIMLVASDPVEHNLLRGNYSLGPTQLPTDETIRVIGLTPGAVSGVWNTRYLKIIPLEEVAILRMEGKI